MLFEVTVVKGYKQPCAQAVGHCIVKMVAGFARVDPAGTSVMFRSKTKLEVQPQLCESTYLVDVEVNVIVRVMVMVVVVVVKTVIGGWVFTVQIFTVASAEPLASKLPEGLKAIGEFPVKVLVLLQLVVSQIFTVLSPELLASKLPEGLKATDITQAVCPVKVLVLLQLVVSQIFTSKYELLASKLPEGLKATDWT
jgi:hypothetical protein